MPIAPFHLMAKPVGPHCNLACRYCFYTEKAALFPEAPARMSDAVLEAYVRKVAEESHGPELHYAWQGGEPTLAGLDFFRKAIRLQKEIAQGRSVSNSLQTNGLLIDGDWCQFLAQEGFLVGLSLDGPAHCHDAYRVDRLGRGCHDQVMRALACFQKHGVAFNTLTSVHDRNSVCPLEVYRFLRDAGVEHMQFIPLVERKKTAESEELGLKLGTPPKPGEAPGRQAVEPWCVQPEAFGDFLIAIFDEWIRNDVGRIFVQTFEVAVGHWMGGSGGLCHFAEVCGRALIVEVNGDLYACDHFVYPEYKRGNLLTGSLPEMIEHPLQIAFGNAKRDSWAAACRKCPYLFACHGGCLKHRFVRGSVETEPDNYLCAGYRRFFAHVDPWFQILSDLLRSGRPAAELLRIGRVRDQGSRYLSGG
ncbi:MAG: anaerobic sulfatase maturase, partial [Kiritimatiellia bacterium]|nr:anaerobic sulfatase maturase [Kiritimatiellia bacterium]